MATDFTSAIHRLIQSTEFGQLRERLVGFRPPEIAAALLDLKTEDQVLAFRALPRKLAAPVQVRTLSPIHGA